MLCNTAIFYDIENLLGIFSGKANTVLNLDEIYRRVLETEGVHGVSIQRAYADWALLPNRALQDSVLQVGIEPIQIFNTNQNDRVKNAADVSLIIDVVELIAKRPEIENYVIASGDGIFAFLSKKLHEHGKRVIGCGFDRNANHTFRYSCDYYIGLEKTDKALVATTSTRRNNRKADIVPAQDAAPAQQTPKKVPDKFPKTKYSERLAQADIPIWRDMHDLAGGLHTIRKIVEALFDDETEGLTDLEISVFKTYVVHYIPSFRVTRYKFSRFGEFMQFVLTGSPFCLYTIDESVCKIARRGAITKGTMLDDKKGLVVTAEDGSRYGSIFSVPEDMAFIYTILPEPGAQENKFRRKKSETAAQPNPETASSSNISTGASANPEETGIGLTASELPKPEPATNEPPKKAPPKNGRRKKVDPNHDVQLQAQSQTEAIARQATDSSQLGQPGTQQDIDIVVDEGSMRRWIKGRFQALSDTNALSTSETKLLTTAEYAKNTFGVRTPIFKEITTRSNLQEQRSIGGKVKYWKETYLFNGKHYLIYKDWVAGHHKERFITWLKSHS